MVDASSLNPDLARSGTTTQSNYGWVMVIVGALAMVATLPGRTHGLGMITERLLADPELELTRTGYGVLNFWATLIGATFCLGIGYLIDRWGLRISIGSVMVLLGLVVLAMTGVTSIAALAVLLTLTRGFGQSALSVVSITAVGKWFPGKPSLPMGVYSMLLSLGFIAVAVVARNYTEIDWRLLWGTIGGSVLGLGILLALIARDPQPVSRSETHRQSTPGETADPVAPADLEADYRLNEALRTPMFWVAGTSISLYGLIVSGISLFNESILVDQGFPKSVYYDSLAIGAGVGMLANLAAGALGLRFTVNQLLSAALLILLFALIWLCNLDSYGDVIGYVVLNAIGGGILTVMFFTVWPKLYGKTHLGSIQSLAQMMTVLASALGPILFAWFRERTGSYIPLIQTLAGMVLLLAIISWLTPLPPSQPASRSSAPDSIP